jgi:mannosyltransferase OCH1-like enzyme
MEYSDLDIIELTNNLDEMFSYCGNIEKKIHISWRTKEIINKDYNIIKNGILQLKMLNPDYEFQIYDDNDIEAYLIEKLSIEDYELIKNKKIVEKTDLWRLLIIYYEGGLYQDIDRFCNKPKCLPPCNHVLVLSQTETASSLFVRVF